MAAPASTSPFIRFIKRPDVFIPVIALVARLIYLLHIQASPYFDAPELDSAMHDRWAREILNGDFAQNEPFFRAPLYYYFLALVYAVFGHSYLIPRVIQVLLGTLSAWLTYRLGRQVFGEAVGIIAGLIYALCGPLIYFDAELRIPALLMPIILLSLMQLDRQREHPSGLGFLMAGGLVGLAALARPNILIFVPFVILWIIWLLRGKIAWIAMFCLGVFLLILPVTLRNYVKSGDLVLVASQAGVNFYIGNNPLADGYTAIVPGTPGDWEGGYRATIRIAENAAGHDLKPSEVSGYWFGRAFDEMSTRPVDWAALTWKKVRLLLSGHEIGNNEDLYYQRRFSWLMRGLMWEWIIAFPFGLLAPLAMAGLILHFNWRKNALLVFFVLSYAVSIILFFVCTRYRLPLIPVLAIWAGVAVTEGYRRWQARKYGQLIIATAVFVLLLAGLNQNPLAGEEVKNYEGAYGLGTKYFQKGQYAEALEAYREAIALDSMSAAARTGLAMTLVQMGQRDEALRELRRTIDLRPAYIKARTNLGQLLQQGGDLAGAQEQYGAVLRMDSTDVFAHRGLADIAMEQMDLETADRHYREAYAAGATDKQLISRWANALLGQGKYAEALEVNGKLLAVQPNNARAHHNQARIYMYCDSLEQAAAELVIVLRLDPDNTEAKEQLEEIR